MFDVKLVSHLLQVETRKPKKMATTEARPPFGWFYESGLYQAAIKEQGLQQL